MLLIVQVLSCFISLFFARRNVSVPAQQVEDRWEEQVIGVLVVILFEIPDRSGTKAAPLHGEGDEIRGDNDPESSPSSGSIHVHGDVEEFVDHVEIGSDVQI